VKPAAVPSRAAGKAITRAPDSSRALKYSGRPSAFGEPSVSVARVIGDFAAKPVGGLEALALFPRVELDLGHEEALELSAEFVELMIAPA
jgi:hypothetical protein